MGNVTGAVHHRKLDESKIKFHYFLLSNKKTNGRPTNEHSAHMLKANSIPMISDSFPTTKIIPELSIKLRVMYNPFAMEGNANPLFWIKARITGVLENEVIPKSSREIIKIHPCEWIKSSIKIGVKEVKSISTFLQPNLSEKVPEINTPAIAAA